MRWSILFVLLVVLVSSCEKDFNIDQQSVSNKMALNSLFNDGAPMVVFLTKPYPIGSAQSNITAIPDARVELYEDNVFKELMHYVPSDTLNTFGGYVSNLQPQAGKSYTVKATEGHYLQATATDQVPVPAHLISSSLQQYTDTGAGAQGTMTMVFKDDPTVQNYYRINVWMSGWHWSLNPQGDTIKDFRSYGIYTHPISALTDTTRDGYFFLFGDQGFNGQEKSLQILFNTIDPAYFSNLNLYVELHTVSKSHYEYFRTLNLYRYSSYSSEPVFIYTDVNNGFGDFVAEHWQTMPFVIK